jgi:hypothetical protein
MVSVSRETREQTDQRLRMVLGAAERVVLPGVWSYIESPLSEPPALDGLPLAVVRDEDSWSVLAEHVGGHSTQQVFGVFSFHFPEGIDNSGFVGWLATALKERLGTGVFVVCGSNTDRGGVYDYWGCPYELLGDALRVLDDLATAT